MTKELTEHHLLSERIRERMDKLIAKNMDLNFDDLFAKCLLDELDQMYTAFYDLREHVYRQEYLNKKK